MSNVYSLRAGDPETIAGYRLVGRLGEGGQGIVFLGRDHAGRSVAIKLLHARFAGDIDARTRFIREISAAKRVARFSTARVLDADVAGERPYIVTEYVEGPSLQRSVAEQGPRSSGALEPLAVGTASALSAIHRAGIVHRDFKPANVLLGPDGPRVIDFGIARVLDSTATLTTHAVGTPAYMAPEQLSRGPIGPAADVFAWGATMVFAATGMSPFGNDTVPAVIGRVLRAEPDLSGVPESVRGLIADCLVKDPRFRPTAQQVLDRILDGANATAAWTDRPVMLPHRETAVDGPRPAARPGSRRRWPWWPVPVAAALVAAVAAGIGIWAFGSGEPKKFTALTHGCGILSPATVRRLVTAPSAPQAFPNDSTDGVEDKGDEIIAGCSWYSGNGAAVLQELSIGVGVQRDIRVSLDGDNLPKGLDRAKKIERDKGRDYQSKAGHTETIGNDAVDYYGRYTTLSGFGDEGFALSKHGRNADGSFDPETVYIQARWGNARLSVEYTSGEIPSEHVMVPTAERVVRERAEAVAHEILRYLSRCGACTR